LHDSTDLLERAQGFNWSPEDVNGHSSFDHRELLNPYK